MKVAKLFLIFLIFIISIPHPEAALADFVEIHGYVRDIEGKPVKGVCLVALGPKPPWVEYGEASTDAEGHYVISLDRPKRLEFPISYKGRPIYEAYEIHVEWSSKAGIWIPTWCVVDTEKRNSVEQDFILRPAGVLKLEAYSPNGTLIERFSGEEVFPVYTTDFYWRLTKSGFAPEGGMIALELKTEHVVNFPWDALGFGRVVLRADNGGEGFILTRQGETVIINLNYELARTECRLLRQSYERYLGEGYVFSKDLSLNIQSAWELLQKADSMADDAPKAHFADSCLNRTLWAAESLELEKARQDIEKYRKGSATLQLVDKNGMPMDGLDITITQITHDFLFGALWDCVWGFDLKAYKLLMETGINGALFPFVWPDTEPSLGEYTVERLIPLSDIDRLRKMGIRVGGEDLIALEGSSLTWDTGIWNLTFERLVNKVYEHANKVASTYSDYVDYWIAIHNPHMEYNPLGFTKEQIIDVFRTGVAAVRSADHASQILLMFDDPGSEFAAYFQYMNDDRFTVDPYTFISRLNDYRIDHDGIALSFMYGSLWEIVGTDIKLKGAAQPRPFRDLGSISRILDWYSTLSEPIRITQFNAPGSFTSNWGYWHRRSWDEELKTEWIEKFYTIAFSKPLVGEITYYFAQDQDYQKSNLGLIDVRYSPRESFYALKRLITENWTTRLHMRTDANGQVEFKGFAGDYNITVSTKDSTMNFTVHVYEGARNIYTLNLGKGKAERAIAQAEEAVSRAKTEGRTIYLDRAKNLLEDARKALIEENYTQAILLAEEANRAADLAVTWLVIPVIIAFAGVVLSGSVILYRRVRARKRKPSVF